MTPREDITNRFIKKMLAAYEGDKKQPFQYLVVPTKDLNTELNEYKTELLHEFMLEVYSALDDYVMSSNALPDFRVLSGYVNAALQEKYDTKNN